MRCQLSQHDRPAYRGPWHRLMLVALATRKFQRQRSRRHIRRHLGGWQSGTGLWNFCWLPFVGALSGAQALGCPIFFGECRTGSHQFAELLVISTARTSSASPTADPNLSRPHRRTESDSTGAGDDSWPRRCANDDSWPLRRADSDSWPHRCADSDSTGA
jgi:hypothetical protein